MASSSIGGGNEMSSDTVPVGTRFARILDDCYMEVDPHGVLVEHISNCQCGKATKDTFTCPECNSARVCHACASRHKETECIPMRSVDGAIGCLLNQRHGPRGRGGESDDSSVVLVDPAKRASILGAFTNTVRSLETFATKHPADELFPIGVRSSLVASTPRITEFLARIEGECTKLTSCTTLQEFVECTSAINLAFREALDDPSFMSVLDREAFERLYTETNAVVYAMKQAILDASRSVEEHSGSSSEPADVPADLTEIAKEEEADPDAHAAAASSWSFSGCVKWISSKTGVLIDVLCSNVKAFTLTLKSVFWSVVEHGTEFASNAVVFLIDNITKLPQTLQDIVSDIVARVVAFAGASISGMDGYVSACVTPLLYTTGNIGSLFGSIQKYAIAAGTVFVDLFHVLGTVLAQCGDLITGGLKSLFTKDVATASQPMEEQDMKKDIESAGSSGMLSWIGCMVSDFASSITNTLSSWFDVVAGVFGKLGAVSDGLLGKLISTIIGVLLNTHKRLFNAAGIPTTIMHPFGLDDPTPVPVDKVEYSRTERDEWHTKGVPDEVLEVLGTSSIECIRRVETVLEEEPVGSVLCTSIRKTFDVFTATETKLCACILDAVSNRDLGNKMESAFVTTNKLVYDCTMANLNPTRATESLDFRAIATALANAIVTESMLSPVRVRAFSARLRVLPSWVVCGIAATVVPDCPTVTADWFNALCNLSHTIDVHRTRGVSGSIDFSFWGNFLLIELGARLLFEILSVFIGKAAKSNARQPIWRVLNTLVINLMCVTITRFVLISVLLTSIGTANPKPDADDLAGLSAHWGNNFAGLLGVEQKDYSNWFVSKVTAPVPSGTTVNHNYRLAQFSSGAVVTDLLSMLLRKPAPYFNMGLQESCMKTTVFLNAVVTVIRETWYHMDVRGATGISILGTMIASILASTLLTPFLFTYICFPIIAGFFGTEPVTPIWTTFSGAVSTSVIAGVSMLFHYYTSRPEPRREPRPGPEGLFDGITVVRDRKYKDNEAVSPNTVSWWEYISSFRIFPASNVWSLNVAPPTLVCDAFNNIPYSKPLGPKDYYEWLTTIYRCRPIDEFVKNITGSVDPRTVMRVASVSEIVLNVDESVLTMHEKASLQTYRDRKLGKDTDKDRIADVIRKIDPNLAATFIHDARNAQVKERLKEHDTEKNDVLSRYVTKITKVTQDTEEAILKMIKDVKLGELGNRLKATTAGLDNCALLDGWINFLVRVVGDDEMDAEEIHIIPENTGCFWNLLYLLTAHDMSAYKGNTSHAFHKMHLRTVIPLLLVLSNVTKKEKNGMTSATYLFRLFKALSALATSHMTNTSPNYMETIVALTYVLKTYIITYDDDPSIKPGQAPTTFKTTVDEMYQDVATQLPFGTRDSQNRVSYRNRIMLNPVFADVRSMENRDSVQFENAISFVNSVTDGVPQSIDFMKAYSHDANEAIERVDVMDLSCSALWLSVISLDSALNPPKPEKYRQFYTCVAKTACSSIVHYAIHCVKCAVAALRLTRNEGCNLATYILYTRLADAPGLTRFVFEQKSSFGDIRNVTDETMFAFLSDAKVKGVVKRVANKALDDLLVDERVRGAFNGEFDGAYRLELEEQQNPQPNSPEEALTELRRQEQQFAVDCEQSKAVHQKLIESETLTHKEIMAKQEQELDLERRQLEELKEQNASAAKKQQEAIKKAKKDSAKIKALTEQHAIAEQKTKEELERAALHIAQTQQKLTESTEAWKKTAAQQDLERETLTAQLALKAQEESKAIEIHRKEIQRLEREQEAKGKEYEGARLARAQAHKLALERLETTNKEARHRLEEQTREYDKQHAEFSANKADFDRRIKEATRTFDEMKASSTAELDAMRQKLSELQKQHAEKMAALSKENQLAQEAATKAEAAAEAEYKTKEAELTKARQTRQDDFEKTQKDLDARLQQMEAAMQQAANALDGTKQDAKRLEQDTAAREALLKEADLVRQQNIQKATREVQELEELRQKMDNDKKGLHDAAQKRQAQLEEMGEQRKRMEIQRADSERRKTEDEKSMTEQQSHLDQLKAHQAEVDRIHAAELETQKIRIATASAALETSKRELEQLRSQSTAKEQEEVRETTAHRQEITKLNQEREAKGKEYQKTLGLLEAANKEARRLLEEQRHGFEEQQAEHEKLKEELNKQIEAEDLAFKTRKEKLTADLGALKQKLPDLQKQHAQKLEALTNENQRALEAATKAEAEAANVYKNKEIELARARETRKATFDKQMKQLTDGLQRVEDEQQKADTNSLNGAKQDAERTQRDATRKTLNRELELLRQRDREETERGEQELAKLQLSMDTSKRVMETAAQERRMKLEAMKAAQKIAEEQEQKERDESIRIQQDVEKLMEAHKTRLQQLREEQKKAELQRDQELASQKTQIHHATIDLEVAQQELKKIRQQPAGTGGAPSVLSIPDPRPSPVVPEVVIGATTPNPPATPSAQKPTRLAAWTPTKWR